MTLASTAEQGGLSPKSAQWPHAERCFPSRELAEEERIRLRDRVGTTASRGDSGERRRKRWRVRKCPACPGFYVSRQLRQVKR